MKKVGGQMKSNKVALSTVAGLCTLLLTGTPAAQAVFQDTAGHWAESAIERMNGYHVVNGYQGQFRPDETITRGEMAVVLDRVMHYQNREDNRFSDLGQDFYTDAILKAGHAGIIQGAEGKVRPNDPISREEAVAMMARAFDVTPSDAAVGVPDAGSISGWAQGAVSAFIQKGYVDGTDTFRPHEPITRAETIVMLNRILSGYYPAAGSFSASANGTVVVSTQDVSLKDMTIAGDLILSEGVQDGDVTLENVIVNGRVLIRGGGAHSIHVLGKSVLGTVVMERDGAAVRLAVDGKDAKVENVTVGEKAAEAIVTGNVSTVTVAGSGKLTAQDAKIGTISVTAPNASVTLTGKSTIKTVEVAENAKNADVSVDKSASVRIIEVEAEGADISGAGKVSEVKANADDVSVDTKGTNVKAAKGTSGITAGGQKVSAGGSTNSTPSKHESSSSSSSSSNRPSRPQEIAIERVESVQNGLVRVTLNRATDTPLKQEQFSIICTGGGKDMTILNVHTTDNRVYDLVTAFYDDNTYNLGITLENGKLLTCDFVSKYDCPEITSTEAVRTAADKAEFSYVSDTSGTFYWMLQEKQATRFRRAADGEPTAEEIMASGNAKEMKQYSNTVEITGLDVNTPYTMYYVAKGVDNKVTPVKRVEIAGTPSEKPDASDITIEEAAAHRTGATDFIEEHVYFEIRLSRATDTQLTLDQFKITCPSNGDMTLGRVESTDNQTYKVYMEKGYMPQDNNHFTCTITFEDGTQAAYKFFVDLTPPDITISKKIERLENGKATISLDTSEPGKIYWNVFKGNDIGANTNAPKHPQKILNDSKTAIEILPSKGQHSFEVDFSDKVGASDTDLYFCCVGEDERGNQTSSFEYEKIPDDVTAQPELDQEANHGEYEITSIVGQEENQGVGRGHVLTVTVNKNETGSSLLSNATIKISGSVSAEGHQQVDTGAWSSNNPTEHEVILKQIVLTEGDYTFEAEIEGKTVKKDFHVDAQGMVTSK